MKIKLEGIFKGVKRIGYEVLREGENNEEFFLQIDEEEDYAIFLSNLEASCNLDGLIFLNIKPCTLVKYKEDIVKKLTDRHVIEIREDYSCIEALIEIEQLKRYYGFMLAIDDYGKEFSNYERVKLLKPEFVKIDVKGKKWSELEDTIKELKRFNVLLIAEKVEDEEAFHKSREIGFDFWQGFYERHLEKLEILKKQDDKYTEECA